MNLQNQKEPGPKNGSEIKKWYAALIEKKSLKNDGEKMPDQV